MSLSREEVIQIVGKRIRHIRTSRNLSIEAAANIAGIEYTQLSRIERGKINTSIYHIYRISKGLDVHVPEIFADLKH